MIFKVPVVRYLGFNQSRRQPCWFGASHPKYRTTTLLQRIIIRIAALRRNMTGFEIAPHAEDAHPLFYKILIVSIVF
jgi:hypothetical protein